jgi:hypothetical protein
MKTLKMSLENIQGKMSRKEMRNIMAGSGSSCADYSNDGCNNHKACVYGNEAGICKTTSGVCQCTKV